jgi:hypothetical protein
MILFWEKKLKECGVKKSICDRNNPRKRGQVHLLGNGSYWTTTYGYNANGHQ